MCDSRSGRQSLIIPCGFFSLQHNPAIGCSLFLTGKLGLLGSLCVWGFVPLLVLAMSAPCIDSAPVRRESMAGGVTPITQSQNYSRNPRLREKGWKIYSSIDSATHSFLSSGLQSHFAIQKIHFPLSSSCGKSGSQQVDVSREMFCLTLCQHISAACTEQKGNLMKAGMKRDSFAYIPPPLSHPQTSLFILHVKGAHIKPNI